MALQNKLPLPDIYTSEYIEFRRIAEKFNRTTTGNVLFTSTSSSVVYNTASSPYPNQGEQGLGLMLYDVLKDYIFANTDYDAMKTTIIANTKGTSDYFTTTGTQPNYVVTTGESYASLPDGFKITIKPHADSTGTVTLNVDGIGAINCVTQEGETVVLKTDIPQTFRYNGVNFTIPSSSGLGSFFGDGSDGTIPNLNAVTTAPNGGDVTALWDMNAGTVFTTGTLSSASDQVVFEVDFGSIQGINSIYIYNASVSSSRTFAIQTSMDGVNWTQRTTFSLSTTTDINAAFTVVTGQYMRLVTTAGTAGTFSCQGASINIGGLQTTKVWRILEPSTLNGGAVVKQYTDFNLPVGYEITTQNPCQGLVIYSQNDITNAGVIDMSQKAGLAPNGNAIPMLITKKAYKTAKTSSLLHFDNNITDDNGRVWTNNGGATFDATNKKFGTHAISFNGTSQWIDTPASDDFSFGSDDFTIDFWERHTTTGTALTFFGNSNTSSQFGSITVYKLNNEKIRIVYWQSDSANGLFIDSVSSISSLQFNHIAIVRESKYLKLYINGVLDVIQQINDLVIQRCLNKFTIGRYGESSTSYFAGQIDEFRIIKGKAMYTANFTPPTSAYTYQTTYIDEPKTLEKYFQLTNVLQTLRGGYGGSSGGYGGGYSGSTGRQTSVGIGGAGRQNLGGFGGGGSGGATNNASGGIGGSILNAEIGAGELPPIGFFSSSGFQFYGNSSSGINGSGAYGSANMPTSSATIPKTGKCLGGGSGGQGASASGVPLATSDSQYAGGFLMLIAKNNITNTGTIRSNGGNGSNGSAGVGNPSGGGGGGSGSGAGCIAIFHKGTYSNTGTIQLNGGAGGTGGSGVGTGEAGGTGSSGSSNVPHIQQI